MVDRRKNPREQLIRETVVAYLNGARGEIIVKRLKRLEEGERKRFRAFVRNVERGVISRDVVEEKQQIVYKWRCESCGSEYSSDPNGDQKCRLCGKQLVDK